MKRIFSLFLAAVMLLGIFAMIPPVQAATGGKLVAITFDDGPGIYTERLLDGLKSRGAKATFFMVGNRVEKNADIVKRVYEEGHQVANHSWSHPELTALSDSSVTSQVTKTRDALNKICGNGTSYMFRAPYGSTNARVRSLVGMPLVYWSVDTLDWKYRNAKTVKNMILDNVYDGAIVLLHDIHSTSVDGALDAIDVLQERGYECVTVQELFRRRGIKPENCTSYSSCKPNGTDLGPVAKPTITSAVVDGQIQVTITAQAGADIYYTTNGSCPNQESRKYTGPFTIQVPCTLTVAAAYNMNGSRSDLVQQSFTALPAAAPDIQVNNSIMTLSTTTKGAKIYYTLNGTNATTSSPVYTGPITLAPNTVITAIAAGDGFLASPLVSGYYSKGGNFFRDVFPNQWFCEAIDQAASAGYMNGIGGNKFAPNDPVTRGQLVTLLYRYAGTRATAGAAPTNPFTDVSQGKYYYDAISWAHANGIVEGYPNNRFLPDQAATRQEMCKIFAAFLEYLGKALPESAGSAAGYVDADRIAPWALPYVEAMTAVGLFQGDTRGYFRPADIASRAQAATVLIRLVDLESSLPDIEPEPEPEPQP